MKKYEILFETLSKRANGSCVEVNQALLQKELGWTREQFRYARRLMLEKKPVRYSPGGGSGCTSLFYLTAGGEKPVAVTLIINGEVHSFEMEGGDAQNILNQAIIHQETFERLKESV